MLPVGTYTRVLVQYACNFIVAAVFYLAQRLGTRLDYQHLQKAAALSNVFPSCKMMMMMPAMNAFLHLVVTCFYKNHSRRAPIKGFLLIG